MSRNRQLGMGGAKTIPEKALHANKDLEFDFKRTARQLVVNNGLNIQRQINNREKPRIILKFEQKPLLKPDQKVIMKSEPQKRNLRSSQNTTPNKPLLQST